MVYKWGELVRDIIECCALEDIEEPDHHGVQAAIAQESCMFPFPSGLNVQLYYWKRFQASWFLDAGMMTVLVSDGDDD